LAINGEKLAIIAFQPSQHRLADHAAVTGNPDSFTF
jgi:hypothetical protein